VLQRDNRWLLSEFQECLDSWSSVIDAQGGGTFAALLWQGRADQALRTAIHFGVIDLEEGRARMLAIDWNVGDVRALTEPDGEGGE
jgi:hypothetical protein